MDAKSLAKSKRAHTQHHNKKSSHSVHKPKAPGGGGVSDNSRNPVKKGNQTTTKSQVQSRRISALPSNSDRYDDDDEELESGKPVDDDVVQPKSKGSDYKHLLSEAQAESQSKIQISNSDCLSSLDDLLHDEFSHILGSMISARGDGILSWMQDDNFIVEEDGSASNQPEFLSLNLNDLAKTLEKVDLHERLYIDADLLPPELCTSQSKPSHSHAEANEPVQQESSGKIYPIVTQDESSVFESESLDRVTEIPILTEQPEKASAIEDDLDSLLNSYGESHNSNQKPCVQKSSAFEDELDSLLGNSESFNKPQQNPSAQTLHHTAGFDDVLDDLLESTSVSNKPQQNQTSSSLGKSKVLDEFDSWLDTI